MGGYITASAGLCDFVRSFASGFIFTTSLPPAVAAGALASVSHLRRSQAERDSHQEPAATLKRRLTEAGLPVLPSESHIVPVLVGDPVACRAVTARLLEHYGINVQPIHYTPVPRRTEWPPPTPPPLPGA